MSTMTDEQVEQAATAYWQTLDAAERKDYTDSFMPSDLRDYDAEERAELRTEARYDATIWAWQQDTDEGRVYAAEQRAAATARFHQREHERQTERVTCTECGAEGTALEFWKAGDSTFCPPCAFS